MWVIYPLSMGELSVKPRGTFEGVAIDNISILINLRLHANDR